MKLNTSIQARRGGTVIATGPSGARYEFAVGADGELECVVEDAADVAAFLATGNFYPADEADFEAALRLTREADADEADGEDDDASMSALPVEANTPPQPARKRAAKKAQAGA